MSWTQFTYSFEKLKEMAAQGIIPSHTLYARKEELENQEKLNTLRAMFAGNDLGESLLVDVLGANKGSMKQSIDTLLEMTEEQRKIQEAQRAEEALLLRLKQEAEERKRKEEEEERRKMEELKLQQEAQNNFVNHQISEFFQVSSDPIDEMQLESPQMTGKEVSIEHVGSPFIYLKKTPPSAEDNVPPKESSTETTPPSAGPSAPQLPPLYSQLLPPTYEMSKQSLPPSLPPPSAPPMDPPNSPLSGNALYYQNIGQYSEDNFFATSWIPLEFFSSSIRKMTGFGDRNQEILSASVTGTVAKGLKNGLGENNCFLNVVIQSLWHLKAFRTKFIDSNQHSHTSDITEDSCPYCALKIIFAQYQFGEEKELPPTLLRKAMSVLYKSQSRFQMGSLNDAAEAHDALMNVLHLSLTNGDEKLDSFVHNVFSLHIIEYMRCECGKPQKPFPMKQFIFHVHADGIRTQASQHSEITNDGKISFSIGLGQAIRKFNESDVRECSNSQCKRKNPLSYALANLPEVLTIGLVWNTSKPTVDYIYEVMNLISRQTKVEDMFNSVVQKGTYTLRGMIAYYGLHYNAFIRNPITEEWLGFDDSKVTKVGNTWDDVIAKCCSGHWQPSVLWYEYASS